MPPRYPKFSHIEPDDSAEAVCRDGAMSLKSAARFCGLGLGAFRRFVASGEIVTLRVGGRRVVPRRALINFLAKKLMEG
jgi:hypothetical protein